MTALPLKKRHVAFAALFLLSCHLQAATYYFSNLGSDSYSSQQARSQKTPWKSLSKLQSFFPQLLPGDSVLFKCGETFKGALNISRSGTASKYIVIGSYGTGAKPVISGLAGPANWINAGSNRWTGDLPQGLRLTNMVVINGRVATMGRYPNKEAGSVGYYTMNGIVGTNQIISNDLPSTYSWVGADIVMRKNRFIINKGRITARSGGYITYVLDKYEWYYAPTVDYKFFIQNHPTTLDRNNEWYHDVSKRKLTVFSTNTSFPTSRVEVSVIDTLMTLKNCGYVSFENISFRGSNMLTFYLYKTQNVRIRNCEMLYNGFNGVFGATANFTEISNTTIRYTNNTAIELNGSDNLVKGNQIHSAGTIEGMGGNSRAYEGIGTFGARNTVTENTLDSIGYTAIQFRGANSTISKNKISNFTLVKDDGGGVYTWVGHSAEYNTGSIISENIITNGITAIPGTNGALGIASGIYIDENSSLIKIYNNTVTKTTEGAYVHNSNKIDIQGNTFRDNRNQVMFKYDGKSYNFTGNTMTNNTCYANVNQFLTNFRSITPTTIVVVNNNKYSHHSANLKPFELEKTKVNFATWKTSTKVDGSSTSVPITP